MLCPGALEKKRDCPQPDFRPAAPTRARAQFRCLMPLGRWQVSWQPQEADALCGGCEEPPAAIPGPHRRGSLYTRLCSPHVLGEIRSVRQESARRGMTAWGRGGVTHQEPGLPPAGNEQWAGALPAAPVPLPVLRTAASDCQGSRLGLAPSGLLRADTERGSRRLPEPRGAHGSVPHT